MATASSPTPPDVDCGSSVRSGATSSSAKHLGKGTASPAASKKGRITSGLVQITQGSTTTHEAQSATFETATPPISPTFSFSHLDQAHEQQASDPRNLTPEAWALLVQRRAEQPDPPSIECRLRRSSGLATPPGYRLSRLAEELSALAKKPGEKRLERREEEEEDEVEVEGKD
ncbi:MAG: hypothetical protein M1814_003563 [Vezdaea aestivalis]|nr:MAG: hypothetical protein M1814_003563 [Vezdaea aestivalis]